MNFIETLVIVLFTNFVTFLIAVWNFRIRLERRLVKLETKVELIQNYLGA